MRVEITFEDNWRMQTTLPKEVNSSNIEQYIKAHHPGAKEIKLLRVPAPNYMIDETF